MEVVISEEETSGGAGLVKFKVPTWYYWTGQEGSRALASGVPGMSPGQRHKIGSHHASDTWSLDEI